MQNIYNYLPNKNNYSDDFLNMIKVLKEIILIEKENDVEKSFSFSNLNEENSTILKKINNTNHYILKLTCNIFYSLTSVNPDNFKTNKENLEFKNFPYNLLLSKSTFSDLELIEKYINIINYLPNEKQKIEILSCIILKQNNISLYNYLLLKANKT